MQGSHRNRSGGKTGALLRRHKRQRNNSFYHPVSLPESIRSKHHVIAVQTLCLLNRFQCFVDVRRLVKHKQRLARRLWCNVNVLTVAEVAERLDAIMRQTHTS